MHRSTHSRKQGVIGYSVNRSVPGPQKKRIQLQAALAVLEENDELCVATLSRLGRTQVEVVNRLHDLQSRGIHVRTLDGLLNTKALGKMAPLVVGLLTGLAEVERELIRERTMESIEHRKRTGGDLGGRPSLEQVKVDHILKLRAEGNSPEEDQDPDRSIPIDGAEGMCCLNQ